MLVVLGWVVLGPNFSTCSGLSWVTWVGLDQSADGLGWIGSHKMDPWTLDNSVLASSTRRAYYTHIGIMYRVGEKSGAIDS